MSEYDSGDDLFITQSTFRSVDTQDAQQAADMFGEDLPEYVPDTGFPEEIVYYDFSKEVDSKQLGSVHAQNEGHDKQRDNTALPILEDCDVDKVDDDILDAALDAVTAMNASDNRFGEPVTDKVPEKSTKGYSDATKKKVQWAFRVYFDWKVAQNLHALKDSSIGFITGEIMEMVDEDLAYTLMKFVLEVRKKNGDFYPSDTLYELLKSIQMYLNMYGRPVKLIDDPKFEKLANVLNNQMKYLSSEGHHCAREKAEVISFDDEDKMWEDGVLGDENPKQLVEMLLFQIGMHFALRAGNESRNLRVGPRSQFAVKYDKDADLEFLEYTEDTSKSNQGGLKHRKVTKKVVRAYANKKCPERCIVRLYRKYLSHRPVDREIDDFYLRPLVNPSTDVWYYAQAMGKNKLSTVVASLAKQVGIQGKVMNHCLRATAATRLYHSKFDEQLVMERTGHRSNAVRCYKRTSNDQLCEISNVLYGHEVDVPVPVKKHKVESIVSGCKEPDTSSKKDDDSATGCTSIETGNASKISLNLTINVAK